MEGAIKLFTKVIDVSVVFFSKAGKGRLLTFLEQVRIS
jgi:hypothetical protein